MVKFLADENIGGEIIGIFRDCGYDVISARDIKRGADDSELFQLANKENRILLTFDLDFGKIYFFHEHTAIGVLIIRIHPQTIENIAPTLKEFLSRKIIEQHSLNNALVILEENKYRVRRKNIA